MMQEPREPAEAAAQGSAGTAAEFKQEFSQGMARNLNITAKCTLLLSFISITYAFVYAKSILVPFVFAVFIYACLRTSTRFLQRKASLNHGLALAIVLGMGIVSLTGFITLVGSSISSFINSAGVYETRFHEFISSANNQLARFGYTVDQATLIQTLQDLPFFDYLTDLGGALTQMLANIGLISIFVLFLLLGEKNTPNNARIAASNKDSLIDEIFSKVSIYVGAKLLLSILTGILVGVVFVSLGLDLAFLFVVLTIVLNFIPNIGSLISLALPLPVALVQFGLSWKFIVLVVTTTIIQVALGSLVEPRVLGKNLELHPVVVLLALVFWGLLWGIPGMFLALPVTSILKMILALFPTTQTLAALFDGNLDALGKTRTKAQAAEAH